MDIKEMLELLTEASYDAMVKNLQAQYPEQVEHIKSVLKWGKSVLKKDERVVWLLRHLAQELRGELDSELFMAMTDELDFLMSVEYQPIQDYQFLKKSYQEIHNDLSRLYREYYEQQEKNRPITPEEGDYVLFKFNDGTEWWYVDRAYCPEEGRSGSHCGNVTGTKVTDQRILSLRKGGHVIMTFILEPDGKLGEMKAKYNQKPSKKYHGHIMKLLMWPNVKGIAKTTTQYAPEMNFNIFDLEPKYYYYLKRNKPVLIDDQIEVAPGSIVNAPEEYRDDLWERAITVDPNLELIRSGSTDDWVELLGYDAKYLAFAPVSIPKLYDYYAATLLWDNMGWTSEVFPEPEDNTADVVTVSSEAANDVDFIWKTIKEIANTIDRSQYLREYVNMAMRQTPAGGDTYLAILDRAMVADSPSLIAALPYAADTLQQVKSKVAEVVAREGLAKVHRAYSALPSKATDPQLVADYVKEHGILELKTRGIFDLIIDSGDQEAAYIAVLGPGGSLALYDELPDEMISEKLRSDYQKEKMAVTLSKSVVSGKMDITDIPETSINDRVIYHLLNIIDPKLRIIKHLVDIGANIPVDLAKKSITSSIGSQYTGHELESEVMSTMKKLGLTASNESATLSNIKRLAGLQ